MKILWLVGLIAAGTVRCEDFGCDGRADGRASSRVIGFDVRVSSLLLRFLTPSSQTHTHLPDPDDDDEEQEGEPVFDSCEPVPVLVTTLWYSLEASDIESQFDCIHRTLASLVAEG